MKSNNADRLISLVRSFSGRRVVVLGDLVADEFVYGDIARVSREAPVLILEHRKTVGVPGGGGNSVSNLKALGARPLLVGIAGRDESGQRLIDALRADGVSTTGILRSADFETPTKSRLLAGGVHTRRQQIVRLDRGAQHGDLPREIRGKLARKLDERLGRAEGLLVADYGYGAATPELLTGRMARLGRAELPVTVDSRSRVSRFRGLTACTPNQEELELATGSPRLGSDRAVAEAARRLLRATRGRAVLATRGARGMCLVERQRRPLCIPAYGSGEVADVTGAGDTVIATLTLGLIVGATTAEAARLANYAAGIVVTKAGTATVAPDELIQAISEDLA